MRRSEAVNTIAAALAQPAPVVSGGWLRTVRAALEAGGLSAGEAVETAHSLLAQTGMSQRDARRTAELVVKGEVHPS